eukprot:g3062.t1
MEAKFKEDMDKAVAEAIAKAKAEAEENAKIIQKRAEAKGVEMTEALNAESKKRAGVEQELEEITAKLEALKTELEMSQTGSKSEGELSATILDLEAKVESANAELEAAYAKLEAIKVDASDSIKKSETDATLRVSEAETALETKTAEVEKLNAKILEMQKTIRENQEASLSKLQDKVAEIEKRAAAHTASEVDAVKERYMTSVTALERKIAQLKEENSQKADQVTRLMEKCAEGSEHEDAATRARSELQKMTELHEEKVLSLERDMQQKIDDLNGQLQLGVQAQEKLQKRIRELQDDLQNARTAHDRAADEETDGHSNAAEAKEQILALKTTISEQQVRIASLEKVKITEKYLQKFRKLKTQNEKLREDKKKMKGQMKEIIAQAKNKISEAETRAASAEKKSFEVLAAGSNNGGKDSTSSAQSAKTTKKIAKQARDLKELQSKLQEYYLKVKGMEKEHKKVASIIKQCCPDATSDIQKNAGIVTRVARFAEVHRELVELSNAESQAVADMEDQVNKLQEQTNYHEAYDKATKEVKSLNARCTELSKTLASREEAAKRTQEENHARVVFLERENLELIRQAKISQKENTRLQKALQNTVRAPEDKENSGENTVSENVAIQSKSAIKTQATRKSARVAAAEAASRSGHTMSETNELALMQELMDDDEALLGDDAGCAEEEDGEPECTTQ